jgi:hypothetical protein
MVLGKIARFMSEESRTWVWGGLGIFWGVLEKVYGCWLSIP